MNECEDFLFEMDSKSKQEQKFNPLNDDSDGMEFENNPASNIDDEGYENI